MSIISSAKLCCCVLIWFLWLKIELDLQLKFIFVKSCLNKIHRKKNESELVYKMKLVFTTFFIFKTLVKQYKLWHKCITFIIYHNSNIQTEIKNMVYFNKLIILLALSLPCSVNILKFYRVQYFFYSFVYWAYSCLYQGQNLSMHLQSFFYFFSFWKLFYKERITLQHLLAKDKST